MQLNRLLYLYKIIIVNPSRDPNLMRSHLKIFLFEDPQQRYKAHRRRDIKYPKLSKTVPTQELFIKLTC